MVIGQHIFQKKLVKNENIILEKTFWKMFSETRDIKEVGEFWLTYFMMTSNLENYFLEYNEEIRKVFRGTMEGQLEHELYRKPCSNKLESDEVVALKQKIKWWRMIVDRGGPIPNDAYDYSFDEVLELHRKTIGPELED